MPTITIKGDTTQEALEQVLYQGIAKYGKTTNERMAINTYLRSHLSIFQKEKEFNLVAGSPLP